MARSCLICNHPKRLQIDRLLVQGRSKTKIASEFDVPTYSLDYHKEHHVSRQMAQHMDRKEAIDAVGLMDELQEIVADTKAIFKRNYAKDSTVGDTTALRALDSRRATFDTILKACQLYHEAKLLELESNQGHLETEQKARTQEGMSRLTDVELECLYFLQRKMAGGDMEGVEVPAIFKAPVSPVTRPPLPPPLPRQKIACTTAPTPVYDGDMPEPGPTPGPEPEPEKPKGLPPQHVTELKEATRAEQKRFVNELRGPR